MLYLTETVLEGQRLNAKHLHLLHLLLVEELHLVHRDDAVTVQVHAAKPILNTAQHSVHSRYVYTTFQDISGLEILSIKLKNFADPFQSVHEKR